MEPTSNRASDTTVDAEENDDASAPDRRLSDFLSRGLRESQRPPPMPEQEEEKPAAPVEPPEPEPSAEPVIDEAEPTTDSTGLVEEPDPEYEIPIGWSPRRRLLAAAVVLGLLAAFVGWRSFRGGKAPSPAREGVRESPIRAVHEPPPPPPPEAEPSESSDEPEAAPAPAGPNIASSPGVTGPELLPSAGPPNGPSVARFPDLPTPVLLQLEQAQQSAPKK